MEQVMTKEVRAKTFKSGNSVALRLPKALGIKEGVEMKVREEQGRYVVEPVEAAKKKIDLSFLDGRKPLGLRLLTPEEREIDPSPGLEELLRKAAATKADS
jgi:antitoxin VapB